ncbi:YczE/YyaS/YitT family protein [Clostridiisalibacter paucivorans]|uniref:YczE/YyaS/YitT family protein n=1 Tax=Clostridiisalibacter paucivorans TaxID=408753 RepID=UPI00047D5FF1|nr:DUF6198 family protein [Clostridiisalibacter paucivorans]
MKHTIRLTLYLIGLFCLALGIVLAIKSDLGVSPVSSIPLSLSNIIGISLGTMTAGIFAFYVVLQILILRGKFKFKSLLQIFFGFVFGFFVDFATILLVWVEANSYFTQVLLILISMFVVAVGIMLIIAMDIVPGAPEGLMLALCDVTGIHFPKMKVWFDTISVVLAATLSFIFLGHISSMREGTIISALLIGKIIEVISKPCKPWLKKVAFYDD